MRSPLLTAVVTAVVLAAGTPALAQDAPPARKLQLTFHEGGLVTLSAANVTVREILTEWARQCGCYVVNADRLSGGPLAIPVLFERTTQKKVLESLLRQAAGYVLTPKRADGMSVSNYETIYILPTSTAVAGTYTPVAQPFVSTVPPPTRGAPEDEIPAVNTAPPNPAAAIGQAARPQVPGYGTQAGAPGMTSPPPGMVPTGQANRPIGAPGVFVPIVPVNPGQTGTMSGPGQAPNVPQNMPTTTPQGTPGMPSAPPPMPVPIVPAPPQSR